MNKKRFLQYLNWLADNEQFNAEEKEFNMQDSKVNRECERVARMLIEMIEGGDFDDKTNDK